MKQAMNRQQVVGTSQKEKLVNRAKEIEQELKALPVSKSDFNKQFCSKHGHVFKITQYHFIGNLNTAYDGGFHGNYAVSEICLCCGEERHFQMPMSLEQVGNTFKDRSKISIFRKWSMKKAEEKIMKKRLELSKELEEIRLQLKDL